MFRRKKQVELSTPAVGTVLSLDDVPDPVFARRSLGDGCAVLPNDGNFHSPVEGELVMVAPTGHAFAVRSDEGAEVLVHIGIDTVRLRGEGFTVHRRAGDRVARGELVVTADLEQLDGRVTSLASPVVVTNGAAFRIADVTRGAISGGQLMVLHAR